MPVPLIPILVTLAVGAGTGAAVAGGAVVGKQVGDQIAGTAEGLKWIILGGASLWVISQVGLPKMLKG